MSEFNIDQFFKSVRAANRFQNGEKNRNEVDRLFKENVFNLPRAEQEFIGKELEKRISDFAGTKRQVIEKGIAYAEASVEINSYTNPADPQQFHRIQMLVPIRANIGKLLGDKASPLTKAFNTAAAALTPEEYKTRAVYTKPMLAVVKAVADQQKNAPKQ